MKFLVDIVYRLVREPPPKPLGRWIQCGDRRSVPDVIEWKVRQKQRRLELLEKGVDPFLFHHIKPSEEDDDDDYLRPFVLES